MSGLGNFVFWLAVAAGLLLGVAIVLATLAAHGTPQRVEDLDGSTLKQISRERANDAYRKLLWSRGLTIVAAICVFVGSAFVWKEGIASDDPSTEITAIATTEDGVTRCGSLSRSSDGALSMTAGGASLALQEASEVEPVDDCPSD